MILKDKTIILGYDDGPLILEDNDVLERCIIKRGGSKIGRFIFTEHPRRTVIIYGTKGCIMIGCTLVGQPLINYKLPIRIRINMFIRNFYIFNNIRYL